MTTSPAPNFPSPRNASAHSAFVGRNSSRQLRLPRAQCALQAKQQAQQRKRSIVDLRAHTSGNASYLLVVFVVVHRGDGIEHLLVVVVHAQGVAPLRQDDQEP